jgi:hypothetical protein
MVQKGESSREQKKREEDEIGNFFGRRIGELEVLVIENHKLYFDIA